MQHKAQTEDQGIQKRFLEHGSPIPRLTLQLQHNPKPLLPVFLSTSHPAWTMQERDHNALSRDVRWDPRTQHCMGVLDACLTDAILSTLRRIRINHYNPDPSLVISSNVTPPV